MQNSSPVRKHSTSAQREKILRAFQSSRLSFKEFAIQAGIDVSTLHTWRRKAAVHRGGGSGFVAVPNLLPALPAPAAYRLQWPGGLGVCQAPDGPGPLCLAQKR
jgi:transposase-like protein